MVIKNVNLETVCGVTSVLPENRYPEVAFAGKSNVGKSSLINALMNRKAYARTSAQPGKTQTINFYRITFQTQEDQEQKKRENREVYYVDLPGYGYARANVEVKAQWGKMIERYLHSSAMLKLVFLLVDIRHEPGANDRLMYNWILEQGYRPVVIATKSDKINRSQIAKQLKEIRSGLGMKASDLLLPFSAESRQGREEIWALIAQLTEEKPETADESTQEST